MPSKIIGWNPVTGPIYGPNGGNGSAVQRTGYDRTLMEHMAQSPWDAEFHVAEPVTLLASAVRQRVTDFTVQGTRLGYLKGVANMVALLTDYDNIRWSLLVNRTPVLGFDNIIGPFGVAVYPKPTMIPLYPDDTIQLVASNLTAIAIPLVTGYLMGYHFPIDVSVGDVS
jgi:hypothetical protein